MTTPIVLLIMKRGKPTYIGALGAINLVQYPYRKTRDAYAVIDGSPVKCCQEECLAEFPAEELITHIMAHDLRKVTLIQVLGLRPDLIPALPYRAQ